MPIKPKSAEKIIQDQLLDYLNVLELQGKAYPMRTQSGQVQLISKRWMHTGRAGCPDITLCYKGRFVGIEVKKENGKQQENQVEAQTLIEKAGGYYFVVRSVDELIKSLDLVLGS